MSQAGEETEQPKRYQVKGEYVQVRVSNNWRIGGMRGAWVVLGFKRHALLTEGQVHPDDLAHVVRQGLVVELPATG